MRTAQEVYNNLKLMFILMYTINTVKSHKTLTQLNSSLSTLLQDTLTLFDLFNHWTIHINDYYTLVCVCIYQGFC